jgi:hypothetical protein
MPEIIFTDKSKSPTTAELRSVLGKSFPLWNSLIEHTIKTKKEAEAVWNFSGPKYGWSLRIKEKKRIIIYLLPREGFFKISFVFGDKASKDALNYVISDNIKKIISTARVYAEGRGFRIDIDNPGIIKDVRRLIDIKLAD